MKFNFMESWRQNQDLNFGEMLEAARAAERAAHYKAREIRKRRKELFAECERLQKECAT